MAASDKALNRIRGLLAQAQSEGATPGERAVFLAKAQELQDKHAVEEWELNQADPERASRPVVRPVLIRSGSSGWQWSSHIQNLWNSIAFHCNISYRFDDAKPEEEFPRGSTVARAVGFATDISFAEMLFAMASLEFYARIEPGWESGRTFDDNVKRLKDSGKKWIEIAVMANRNGGNPRTGREGSTTDGSWLITAYKRECKRLGVEPTRHTQRHGAFRKTFARGFAAEIDGRLAAMRSTANKESGESSNLPVVLTDRREKSKQAFWEMFPDMHPDEIRKRFAAKDDAERARREALSPKEREREDREYARWWERHRAEQERMHDPNGWVAGTEAARNVDLTGGANHVPTSQPEAIRG